MTKYTPGPWIVTGKFPTPITIRPHEGGPYICQVNAGRKDEEYQANARLIAAASDLLEACKYALSGFLPQEGRYKILKRAIAKAEGKE